MGESLRISKLEAQMRALETGLEKEKEFSKNLYNKHLSFQKLTKDYFTKQDVRISEVASVAVWATAIYKALLNRGIVKTNIVARFFAWLFPFRDKNGIEREAKEFIDRINQSTMPRPVAAVAGNDGDVAAPVVVKPEPIIRKADVKNVVEVVAAPVVGEDG